jgi:hypothetical protein
MQGDPIVLVNRTSNDVSFVADSRHYILKPGKNYGYVQGHAFFALSQNPLMGSEDYHTLDFQSLVGVEGQTDCTELTDEALLEAGELMERFDRSTAGLAPTKTVKTRHPAPRGRQVASTANSNALAIGA